MAEGRQINILANIYNNIQRGLELEKTLIMAQGSGRSGKTYNILETLALECLQHPIRERTIIDPTTHKTMILQEPLLVSVVRKSLPVLKRSAYRDFKTIMISMGVWNDRRMNKTDWIYTFETGAQMEFFSADDEQKLRGPSRHILYVNEANEIEEYAFSQLRMRTYEYAIVDYNPSFTPEHWLFPLIKDSRTYHFISTYKENIFLPQAAIDEIESYKETHPALWKIYGEGQFAVIDGLVFPEDNWDIIPDDEYPDYKVEEELGIDWGFFPDPTVCIGVCILGNDIYLKEHFREYELKSGDIAQLLNHERLRGKNKHCDIDKRLVAELEAAGVTLLFPTKKNGNTILTGIRLMNQRRIHICASSTDLIKEFRNYCYKKDRHDEVQTNVEPIDKFNHGIDAARYVILDRFEDSYMGENRPVTKRDLNLFM